MYVCCLQFCEFYSCWLHSREWHMWLPGTPQTVEATEQILFRKSVAVTLVTSSDQDRDTPSCHRHITHEQRCHLHTIHSLQS